MRTGHQAETFQKIVDQRLSCRRYRPDPVPEDALMKMVDAARAAPSACNRQPWRFVIVRDGKRREQLVTDGLLPGIRMQWALDAPVIVVIGMARDVVTHRIGAAVSGIDYPWIDVGIAGEHLVLAAAASGLGTCWIGWIRTRRVRKIVEWPRSIQPVSLITVGYAAETGMEQNRSSRLAAADTVKWL